MSFQDLKLSPALCRTVEARGYTTPTPVQAQSIPVVLAGTDLLAAAQTGTGKTAAFALPILQRLEAKGNTRPVAGHPRVLVLAPTRELAMQVQESFRTYGKGSPIRSLAVFGGAGMVPQTQSLRRGVDIVVATPGRLLDHMGQGNVSLSKVEILVLDEADRMLDMGFMPDLERILGALPEQRQSLLFSATFPKEIRDLATRLLRDPVEVQIARPNSAAPQVSHALHMVEREGKKDLLIDMLSTGSDRQALVFCRTRHGSDRLCRQLQRAGFATAAIHGDKSQAARTRALGEFKSGRTSVLVATDVAARGLDIRQLPLVVNFDLPQVPEDYIHRIGRTGRAGDVGRAVSLVSRGERELLREIEQLLNRSIEVAARPPRTASLSESADSAYSDSASSGMAAPSVASSVRMTSAGEASSDVTRVERMSRRPHRSGDSPRSNTSNRTSRHNPTPSSHVPSSRAVSNGARGSHSQPAANRARGSRSVTVFNSERDTRPEHASRAAEPRRDRHASYDKHATADTRANHASETSRGRNGNGNRFASADRQRASRDRNARRGPQRNRDGFADREHQGSRGSSVSREHEGSRGWNASREQHADRDRSASWSERTGRDRNSSRSQHAGDRNPSRSQQAGRDRNSSREPHARRDRHASSDRPTPRTERRPSERAIARGGASDRRDRPAHSHSQERKNKFAVSFTSAKGKPFWWPFAGKQRPGESDSAGNGRGPRARRRDRSASDFR